MDRAGSKWRKATLLGLAGVLLLGSSWSQTRLNRDRTLFGLTRVTPLENAPPVLALTTVVLGGFRGLIANALWVRAMDLQDEDKFFEMVQLADWITKLQPHIATVWIVEAWNMSYNISIKFTNPADRWFWVQRGISLLRDQALKYNPHTVLIYRELAWQFQHKMGQNLDDAHLYFKAAWAGEMERLMPGGRPDFPALIHPRTPEEKERAATLRDRFKLDPVLMEEVDKRYGPLEWRLPETHAIYWAYVGLKNAKTNKDLMTLRRVIYQSMQTAFRRGKLIENRFDHTYEFVPNLDIIPQTSAAYEQAMLDEPEMRQHIEIAHKNDLLDAVYFLYTHNRLREAQHWLDYVKTHYPKALPPDTTLDGYALKRVGEDIAETDMDRTTGILEGVITKHYLRLAQDQDAEAAGYALLARNIWNRYQGKILSTPSAKRVPLPPLEKLQREVLDRLLDPKHGFIPPLAAALRTKLGLPAPTGTNAPPPSLPTPPAAAPTNTSPAAPATGRG